MENKNFTSCELKMLLSFLEQIEINQMDSSCNDLILPKTPEHIDFVETNNQLLPLKEQLSIIGDEIVGLDITLTQYYIKRIREIINNNK